MDHGDDRVGEIQVEIDFLGVASGSSLELGARQCGRTFSEIRAAVIAHPGASNRVAELRRETLEEIDLYETRHREAIHQIERSGRLAIRHEVISKLEDPEDVRVSTLWQYLESFGAQLGLVAVFEDPERRLPVELVEGTAT